ncbi:molybdopterin converting factor [Prevotella veroralis]|nr:molybdopterin converting factor [Prevotella veroralis]
MGKELGGTVEGDGAMRVKRYEVERYGIESYGVESYRIESGTNKKREL